MLHLFSCFNQVNIIVGEHFEGFRQEWHISTIMLEIHRSGREPSNCVTERGKGFKDRQDCDTS